MRKAGCTFFSFSGFLPTPNIPRCRSVKPWTVAQRAVPTTNEVTANRSSTLGASPETVGLRSWLFSQPEWALRIYCWIM
jgi:hypothetical protein